MTDLRFLAVPALLLVSIVGYVALNPGGAAVEPIATETPPSVASPAAPIGTPSPAPSPVPGELQLSALTGVLTYQSVAGLVSVAFPSGASVTPPELDDLDWSASDDGEWHVEQACNDNGTDCEISFSSRDGRESTLPGRYDAPNMRWRPATHTIAFSAQAGAARIVVVDDPSDPRARVVYDADAGQILAFEWHEDGFLVAFSGGIGTQVQLVNSDGSVRTVAESPSAISYFHASPDRHSFAFSASDPAGWRLFTVDAATGTVTDHGAMGSDGPGAVPVADPPDGKGPMYISWSPDGSRLAFGGGFSPPYTMTTLDLATNAAVRSEFPSGYPGEIRWSPDGTQIAVSTYDVERTHHETWVVDPMTGAGTHLMDGCVIVWSPDSRFLAVHGEDIPGIAIIDVATGARMQLTASRDDAPLLWTP